MILDLLEGIWEPHPGQKEFLKAKEQRKVLACGRRWGKTDSAAVWLLASLIKAQPQRLLTVAPTLDQARLVFNRVESLLLALMEAGRADGKLTVKQTPYPVLNYDNHELVARSAHHIHRLRGREATRIVVDEAAFVPGTLVTDVLTPMLATTRGDMALISSPNGQNHFWRAFEMGRKCEHGTWARRAPSEENPLVSREFLAAQRQILPDSVYRVEFEAEFLDSAGAIFPSELIERSVVGEIKLDGGQVVIGVDWARYRDYTAIVVAQVSGGRMQVIFVDRLFREPWSLQVAKVKALAEHFPARMVACDSTGVGDAVTEQLSDAIPDILVEPKVITASSKLQLINDLRVGFERDRLVLPPNPDLLRELQHFTWRQGRMEAASGFHDDLVIALALAFSVAPKASPLKLLLGDARRFSQRVSRIFSRCG